MKRMPCKAFFSITMPLTGERKVSVRVVVPESASALICASEMSQLRSRCRLASASCCMPACAWPPASFRLPTPCMAIAYSRWAETSSGLYTSNNACPLPTAWPVTLTCRRST